MEVRVLGCGEAFDDRLPNTSFLLRSASLVALLDCGYSVPPRVFQSVECDEIDLIYISHAHADHYFGLPAVLGRWWEEGRTKPLTIISQPAVIDQIRDLSEYGYRGLASRFQYPIHYRAARAGEMLAYGGAELDFAETRHSVSNYALRVRINGRSFCYSGDGMFTDQSASLFEGADLLIHEAYSFEPSPVHGDIPSLLKMASERRVSRVALVHVQRGLRRDPGRIIEAMNRSEIPVTMPEPDALLAVG